MGQLKKGSMNDFYFVCGRDIREIQSAILEIAKEIKRICDKNDIIYVLDGGTLLGAVRHKGFIPWDDDLDIAMTRDNYEKFLVCCKKDLNKDYFVQNNKTEVNYPFDFTKIKKNNTIYTEDCMTGLNVRDGVYVDVFPIDKTFERKWRKQGKALSFWRNVRWTKLRYKLQPLKKKIVTLPFALLSLGYINKKAEKIMTIYNKKSTSKVAKICHPGPKKPCEPAELYLDTIDLPFEDTVFKCPRCYETLLRNRYGNFMELPSQDERRSTHGILNVKL